MWALRRASLRLSSQGFNVSASSASFAKLVPTARGEDESGVHEPCPQITCRRPLSDKAFYPKGNTSLSFTVSRRELSSQADTSSTKDDDDLEGGLSELETCGNNKEFEMELDDDDEDIEKPHNEIELSDTEVDPSEKRSRGWKGQSELFKAIINAPGLSVHSALNKWIEEGKELSREEISFTLFNLRRRKMYGRALQLYEWLESNQKLEFMENDYASQLDLIAKVRGLLKAEKFINNVPESFRGELLYRTLLANSVKQNNVKKTEETFNKMKELGFPVTTFVCNNLLLMYKRVDKKKISDVLLLMETHNVQPCLFTYKILIETKGQINDIAGMEQIVETMEAEGIKPDIRIQAALVRYYTSGGLKEKAEAILKEMEGEDLKETLWLSPILLRLYAILGKVDEVERIWKGCESKPRIEDCLAAVEAWGKLKKIEEAEAVFEMMSKKWKLSSKNYTVLLNIYANNTMLQKGKDLAKRMAGSGCKIGPLTWDSLVKLYVQAGEVEKADSLLHKATQQSTMKPLFNTFMAILQQYANRGDIHNSEKIFQSMRKAGYISRQSSYNALIQAYINAKMPAYGIRERMKADNLFPNKALADLLVLVDAFKKNPVLDLLE